jgi:predicted nucleic acid-binding protein
LKESSVSLSPADLSLIKLGLEHNIPIATDDKILRQYAKNLGLSITGSLGLLKALYQKRIIKKKEKYLSFLESLKKDVYISDELMRWALEDL